MEDAVIETAITKERATCKKKETNNIGVLLVEVAWKKKGVLVA